MFRGISYDFANPQRKRRCHFYDEHFYVHKLCEDEDGALKTVGAIKSGFSDFAFSAVALHIKNKTFLSFFSAINPCPEPRELKDQRPSNGGKLLPLTSVSIRISWFFSCFNQK